MLSCAAEADHSKETSVTLTEVRVAQNKQFCVHVPHRSGRAKRKSPPASALRLGLQGPHRAHRTNFPAASPSWAARESLRVALPSPSPPGHQDTGGLTCWSEWAMTRLLVTGWMAKAVTGQSYAGTTQWGWADKERRHQGQSQPTSSPPASVTPQQVDFRAPASRAVGTTRGSSCCHQGSAALTLAFCRL